MAYSPKNANGQATMANSEPVVIASDQSTVPVSLASVPSHAVTNAGTFAVQNTASTPAGTNNIGDVDVLTVNGVAPAFGTGLRGATVQRVTIATDDSVPVTNAGITTIAGAVSGTEMQVDVLTMPTVTVTATNLDVQSGGADLATTTQAGAIQTAVELIDDTVKVLGTDTYTEAASKGVVMGAVRRDADTTLANTTNEFTPLQVDANGYLKVEIFDGGGSHTVDNNGTFATQVDGAALTALQLIDDPVFADDAAFTLSTSKGHVMAGVAVQTDGTDPSAVSAEGDASAIRTDMNRILLVNTTPPRLTSATENNATAQTNNPILSAPGAGLSLYITDIIVSNGATAGSIKFVEDTAGTPVIKVQETYMAINGGAVIPLKTPIRITANKDFGYTSTTVTTHSVTVSGYIAP